MARALAYDLAKDAYRLNGGGSVRQPSVRG
jgi:hypothetical protein